MPAPRTWQTPAAATRRAVANATAQGRVAAVNVLSSAHGCKARKPSGCNCVHNATMWSSCCSHAPLLSCCDTRRCFPMLFELTHDRCKRTSLYMLACHFRNVFRAKTDWPSQGRRTGERHDRQHLPQAISSYPCPASTVTTKGVAAMKVVLKYEVHQHRRHHPAVTIIRQPPGSDLPDCAPRPAPEGGPSMTW